MIKKKKNRTGWKLLTALEEYLRIWQTYCEYMKVAAMKRKQFVIKPACFNSLKDYCIIKTIWIIFGAGFYGLIFSDLTLMVPCEWTLPYCKVKINHVNWWRHCLSGLWYGTLEVKNSLLSKGILMGFDTRSFEYKTYKT